MSIGILLASQDCWRQGGRGDGPCLPAHPRRSAGYKRHRPLFLRAALVKHGLRKVLGNETSHRNSGSATAPCGADGTKSVECCCREMERRAALDSTSSATMPSILAEDVSSVVMLQSGSVRRMSWQIDNDMVIRQRLPIRRSSWPNMAISQWLPKGSALKTESTTVGGKDCARDLGQTLSTQSAPTWMHPNGGIVFVRHRVVARMFERIIQYLIVTFGANDQATDESLSINQLWNDHPESIAFLPPDFNVSMFADSSGQPIL